jgi:general secretion pathway protein A
MYKQFFKLQINPFSMTPDPAFLFLTDAHREALAGLMYAVLGRKGIVILTGDAGTGKTTLLRKLLQSVPAPKANYNVVLNPTLTSAEFLELILMRFGIADIPSSKAQRLMLLQQFLLRSHEQDRISVLIIDEAHKLPPDVLEEIRLLTNLETADHKLLQIIMAGQNELTDVMRREDLRQLKQRIALRLTIQHLSSTEIRQYLQFRWKHAGGASEHPFTPEAVELIAQWSRGIPRVMNAICDNALLLAFGAGQAAIGPESVCEVATELDLLEPSPNGKPKAAPAAAGLLQQAKVAVPVGTAGPVQPFRLRTLEAYEPKESRSHFGHWMGRLGFNRSRS